MHTIFIFILIVIVGIGTFLYTRPETSEAPTVVDTPVTDVPSTPTNEVSSLVVDEATTKSPDVSTYKDGTHTATGSYRSPAGTEIVQVSLTLADDVITEATFSGTSENKVSKKFMGQFNDAYTSLVVGKKIDTLDLTVVNGSSLTPKGFMDAVTKIKSEAL